MSDIFAKELLVLHVEVGCPTLDWKFGKQLLSVFTDIDKRLNPQTLHIWSDKVADFKGLEMAKDHWAKIGKMRSGGSLFEFPVGLSWKRCLTTKYQAEIHHENQNLRGNKFAASFSFYAVPHKQIDWQQFANRIYELTQANIGFLHIHRDAHVRSDKSTAREPNFGLHDCTENSIPELAWSTFIGPKYHKFIDNAALSTSGASIDKLGNGLAITITKNVMDVCNDFEKFTRSRELIKATFPSGFIAQDNRNLLTTDES